MGVDSFRARTIAVVLGSSILAAACTPVGGPGEEATWKAAGSVTVTTAAPDAGGALTFRNCPTNDEARAAVPGVASGPDANAVPFKTMVLQCTYGMQEPDVQGRPSVLSILVFDASVEGIALWDTTRGDPAFPNPVDLPGLGDRSFATGKPGQYDLWVVQGVYGFHMFHTRQQGVALDQMTSLARAMLAGLVRPPR